MLRLAALLFLVVGAVPALAGCRADQVALRGDWGQAQFTVELAETPEARGRGLMFRESLPRGAGMLFVYEHPQHASFWMKNTLIPLDMIFADRTGRVTRVHGGAIPGDLTPIDGGPGVYAVLEINAQLAERYGIAPGTVMRHPVFEGGPAAWPC
ncbi:MAG: DUF192 domain-containing protein [Antarcticimicrobium sp.]|uniref:DUF192 domain-containing protein n=1 Tax=Antarcticimicrobium sp. TaxID=2824147 RepID=UPI0026079B26|nr:DUF192 domain-containing protein [Antarcticimicrobium sp.]MDF1717867.1 DUF192 domain-containing protein [Antarcticimicrobium sp.]